MSVVPIRYGRYEPVFRGEIGKDRRLNDHVIRAINEIRRGAVNWGGQFNLELSSTTTEVLDDRVTLDSVILLMPESAAAAAESGIYISARNPSTSFTIAGHASAGTTRTFRYIIVG